MGQYGMKRSFAAQVLDAEVLRLVTRLRQRQRTGPGKDADQAAEPAAGSLPQDSTAPEVQEET